MCQVHLERWGSHRWDVQEHPLSHCALPGRERTRNFLCLEVQFQQFVSVTRLDMLVPGALAQGVIPAVCFSHPRVSSYLEIFRNKAVPGAAHCCPLVWVHTRAQLGSNTLSLEQPSRLPNLTPLLSYKYYLFRLCWPIITSIQGIPFHLTGTCQINL